VSSGLKWRNVYVHVFSLCDSCWNNVDFTVASFTKTDQNQRRIACKARGRRSVLPTEWVGPGFHLYFAVYRDWMAAYADNHQLPLEWAEKGVLKEDYVLPSPADGAKQLLRRLLHHQELGAKRHVFVERTQVSHPRLQLWHSDRGYSRRALLPVGDADEQGMLPTDRSACVFTAPLRSRKRGPGEHRETQIDGRRVESIGTLLEFGAERIVSVQHEGTRYEDLCEISEDVPVVTLVGVEQSRP
jgi:hypothetical protein